MQVYKPAFLAMSSFTSDKFSLLTARKWCMAEGSQAGSGFMRTFSLLTSQVNHFCHERRTLNELTDRSQQAEVRATYVFPTFTCSNCFLSFQHPSALQDREFLADLLPLTNFLPSWDTVSVPVGRIMPRKMYWPDFRIGFHHKGVTSHHFNQADTTDHIWRGKLLVLNLLVVFIDGTKINLS